MDILISNLQSPIILFFILGVFSGLVKSDLEIPPIVAKGLALYLIAAIGLKGGIAIAEKGEIDTHFLVLIGCGIILGFVMPFLGYELLRKTTKHSEVNCAAIAGHYGSVSLVTFIAAGEFLKNTSGEQVPGSFIALLAVMESPAILSALLLAMPHIKLDNGEERRKRDIFKEVFFNGTMVLLLGSMVIGYVMSEEEIKAVENVFITPFKGILMFFLLDMGINIGKRSELFKELSPGTILFSFYMPLIAGFWALALAIVIDLSFIEAFLFMILSASASYIAVPAAFKIALPEANRALYTTLPLALTFPFNITIGIPLYYFAAHWAMH